MIRTAILLVVTLFAACGYTYFQAPALSDAQWALLTDLFWIWGGFTAYTIIAGELTGNCSQVDRLWSIVPIVYTGYAAYFTGWDTRATLMAGLVALWGARLTFNFARRGGYHWLPWKGEEDYRWEVLRQQPPLNQPFVWKLFNIFFICIYQMALIALFTLPIVYAWRPDAAAVGTWDYVLAIGIVVLVIWEWLADQQQWDYQQEKHRRKASNEDLGPYYGKGFTHTGLWRWSRHPNYFAEQSIWVVFYGFSITSTGEWLNASILGAILLIFLFQGSAQFSEGLTAAKYPEYQDYQAKTPRFLPMGGFKK